MDLEAKCLDLDNESKEDPQEEANDEHPLADFEAFTRWRPQEDFTHMDLLESLGTWEMDYNYDWSPYVSRYDLSPEIQDQIKAKNPIV